MEKMGHGMKMDDFGIDKMKFDLSFMSWLEMKGKNVMVEIGSRWFKFN